MKRYWAYLKSILHHKFYVCKIGLKMDIPIFQLIMHDMSKFRPSEFFPYARALYSKTGKSQWTDSDEFDKAWLLHQHRNKHHWQYWVVLNDSGTFTPVNPDIRYTKELVADYLAMTYNPDIKDSAIDFFDKIRDRIRLHPEALQNISRFLYKYRHLDNHRPPDVFVANSFEHLFTQKNVRRGSVAIIGNDEIVHINCTGRNACREDWEKIERK